MKYTEMEPGALYRCENHLYCFKDGKYHWLAYDHFSKRYLPTWKSQTQWDMESLKLSLVTPKNCTPGIRVQRDAFGRPKRFEIMTIGSTK